MTNLGKALKGGFAAALTAALALLLLATCGGREEQWDGDPDPELLCGPDPRNCPEGGIGARCSVSDECADGICCLSGNCGGGMCTYLCGGNGDCPPSMLCDGGFCFYTCRADAECAPGQECERDDTICQY
jgi:hypothetical protein